MEPAEISEGISGILAEDLAEDSEEQPRSVVQRICDLQEKLQDSKAVWNIEEMLTLLQAVIGKIQKKQSKRNCACTGGGRITEVTGHTRIGKG